MCHILLPVQISGKKNIDIIISTTSNKYNELFYCIIKQNVKICANRNVPLTCTLLHLLGAFSRGIVALGLSLCSRLVTFIFLSHCMKRKNYIAMHIPKTRVLEHDKRCEFRISSIALDLVFNVLLVATLKLGPVASLV